MPYRFREEARKIYSDYLSDKLEKDLEIKQLMKEVKEVKERLEYKECPLCYGVGEISTPSGELDYTCWSCNGTGKVKKND